MSIVKKIIDKLYLKQWGIGFIRQDISELIRTRNEQPAIDWIPSPDPDISSADPFIHRAANGDIHLLFERMTSFRMDGTIRLSVLDKNLKIKSEKEVLNLGSHLSYPFLFREAGKTYVFPENALGGDLVMYEYDEDGLTLTSPRTVLTKAVLDSTIIKRDGKYWLFCTHLADGPNQRLHLYFADALAGPYIAHPKNPVSDTLSGSRPAGAIFEVDGQLYRPAQNCTHYYGESLVINRIQTMSETEFNEERYMEIKPNLKQQFGYGMHHIHFIDNLIVVDGQRNHFQPVQQMLRKISNSF